jgi:hypothetical protein
LISEKETVIVPQKNSVHPWYHGLDNNSFMYSIHHTVENEVQNQRVVEDSPDMICMFNGISSMDDLPKCDQGDDEHEAEIDVDCSKQSTACHWKEEDHSQFRYDNQPLHNSHDSDEEGVENFRVRKKSLPLCFSSFQFLRGNCKQVVNGRKGECSDQLGEDASADVEAVLNPESQHLPYFYFQIHDERLKPKTDNELIHCDSLPLYPFYFQIVRGNLGRILVENHSVNHEVPRGPISPPSKTFYDPIVDIVDDVCFQSLVSFTPNELKHCYDIDMFKQSTPLSGATEASFHKPSENPQSYKEVLKDTERIGEKSSLDAELFEVENQKMGQTYIDPVNTYMESFFNTGYFSIASVFPIVRVYQILCKAKQVGNYS